MYNLLSGSGEREHAVLLFFCFSTVCLLINKCAAGVQQVAAHVNNVRVQNGGVFCTITATNCSSLNLLYLRHLQKKLIFVLQLKPQ